MVVAALFTIGTAFGMASALPGAQPAATSSTSPLVSQGKAIFLRGCSSCHGLNAEGGAIAPSLIGVGAAAVDFQVGTGRMPMADMSQQAMRKKPVYNADETAALAAYVASLAPGPASVTSESLNWQRDGNIAQGGQLMTTTDVDNWPADVNGVQGPELMQRFQTAHPFALEGLMTSGKTLLKALGNDILLELGTRGQTAFGKVLEPFCAGLDFDQASSLASRYFPLGRRHPIVVDPRCAFGRPVIEGTNLTTEAVMSLLRGGEAVENIAESFRVAPVAVLAAKAFEQQRAA